MELPKIGLGTWDLRGSDCTNILQLALAMGYRHVDTAQVYQNQKDICKAIKGFDRQKLYLTSKITLDQHVDRENPQDAVAKACEVTLKELGVDYLDLYLIHAPDRSFPLESIFRSMEKLVGQEKVRMVGVSNYTLHHLQDLHATGHIPFANQIEFHPYLNQQALLDYCNAYNIALIAYRPFGKGKLLTEEPLFDAIGIKYNKSGAQIILRWLIQKGISVIPKASSEKHLKENLEVFDFSLTQEDMLELDRLHRNKRYCRPENPEHTY